MNEFTKQATDDNFEKEVLGADNPVLVDFWAAWCGPCRALGPVVEQIAEKYQGKLDVFKMDVDNNGNAPQRFGIRGIPTLIVFKGGEEQERVVGGISGEAVAKIVEKYI
jgi:thioredoxin 1